MAECRDLGKEAAQRALLLSSTETAIGAQVNVTCAFPDRPLVGTSQLTCTAFNVTGARWSHDLPQCLGEEGLSEREKVVIGVSVAVVGLLLLVIVIVAIIFHRARTRTRQNREDRLAQTLERLSIRDPLDDLVRRESRRSSFANPAFANPDDNPDTTDTRKLYKVWDVTRTRKQFVFAEGLDDLAVKGGEKLGLVGPLRAVLEEDGTEIDNDAVLRACANMVFLLLEPAHAWTAPAHALHANNVVTHYTYGIDEKL